MLANVKVKRGEWTLLLLRVPGREPIPGGVLLVDPTDDGLYVRLRADLVEVDADIALFWEELELDLLQQAAEMGGANVIRSLQEASNTVFIGDTREVQMTVPEEALNQLFSTYVSSPFVSVPEASAVLSQRHFSKAQITAACERLPISRAVGIRALKALGNSTSDFRKIAEIIEKDPVLTAHLLKLGNLASVSRGEETKSVTHALTRIGLDQATFHIWALCMKNLYSSPPLQSVWNHSLRTVEAMDDLCKQTRYSHTTDARLAALLHDIGHLVLFALGDEYSVARASLLDLGIYPMEIERRLCGITHAEIGADLLVSWEFPRYMTDAIRHHHAPFQSDSVLTALLYSCECWTDSGEDVYDPLEHQHAAGLLGLNAVQFSGDRQHRADLRLLRFAA